MLQFFHTLYRFVVETPPSFPGKQRTPKEFRFRDNPIEYEDNNLGIALLQEEENKEPIQKQ
jgi:hypothetical protein